MKSKYEGKRVLMTGATGFLGKVLLEKFLFSLDCVDRFYVLIRPKAGSRLHERFKKQIISSPCFDRLRQKHKQRFDQFIQQKVVPIQGDLQKEGLGMSKETLNEVVEHCNIIINCAANIDFNAPLNEAINTNIQGSLQMLELARKVKHLDIFTHVSTCYVNSDHDGRIPEDIIYRGDPEDELRKLLAMSKNDLLSNTKKIIGKFPNTYTYTKCLCERMMKARQGDVPICIVRPSAINGSYAEPFPGWLDVVSAAGAIYFFIGMGIVHTAKCNPNLIGDPIPVDVVAATIIVATACNVGNKQLSIYHSASSGRNPLTWGQIIGNVIDYWRQNKAMAQVDNPNLFASSNQWALKIHRLHRKIPLQICKRLGPLLGGQMQKNAQHMEKVVMREQKVSKIFQQFWRQQWIFECNKIDQMKEFMNAEERKEFLVDVADIDMLEFTTISNYGLHKFILKENSELKPSVTSIPKNDRYFSDIRWALNTNVPSQSRILGHQMKAKLLSSTEVSKVIEAEIKKIVKAGKGEREAVEAVKIQAERIINQLAGEVKVPVVKTMAWTLHKSFKKLFQKVIINSEMIEQLRKIEECSTVPIVLVPTNRSYLDFLVVAYIFFMYKLRVPNFVADEVLMKANLFPFLLRSAGAFFFQKPLYSKSHLYRTIFDKYLELLLCEGSTLEFCIEGSRSRTGKLQAPTFELMNVVLDTVLSGKVSDVCFVPLTINYEKIVEADNLTGDNLGEEKVAEGLLRMLRSAPFASQNNGRVYVHICKPIMAKQFISNLKNIPSEKHKELEQQRQLIGQMESDTVKKGELSGYLAREIVERLTKGTVITTTALVSSVLLMHRKGISEEELVRYVSLLAKYILKKGYLVGGCDQKSAALAVRKAINLLSGISKSKSNIFQLNDPKKITMLSYYRNSLVHAFLPEAFVGCALASFAEELSSKQGVPLEKLHEQTLCLMRILRNDYLTSYSLESFDKFTQVVKEMNNDLIVNLKDGRLTIHPSGQRIIAFYFSLLRPHIDCHCASIAFILSISRNHNNRFSAASISQLYGVAQWFFESKYAQRYIEYYEACLIESIKSAFSLLKKEKVILLEDGRNKKPSSVQVLATVEQLEDIQNRIKFFRKNISISIFSLNQTPTPAFQSTPKL